MTQRRHVPLEVREYHVDSLMIGGKDRLHHMECSAHKFDRTLSVTRVVDGLLYHCYRCGLRGIRWTTMSPSAASSYLRERMERRYVDNINEIELPIDFEPMCRKPNKIHPRAYAWLYQYELEDHDLCTYNIGFSNKLQRIVMPIYLEDKLVGWVGRYIHYKSGCGTPKYHNEFREDDYVYFHSAGVDDGECCVYVEDIVSAIKVSKGSRSSCVALLTTSLSDAPMHKLLRFHSRNYLWLDEDAYIKGLRLIHKYKMSGFNITQIRTSVDPKQIPLTEIPNYVG